MIFQKLTTEYSAIDLSSVQIVQHMWYINKRGFELHNFRSKLRCCQEINALYRQLLSDRFQFKYLESYYFSSILGSNDLYALLPSIVPSPPTQYWIEAEFLDVIGTKALPFTVTSTNGWFETGLLCKHCLRTPQVWELNEIVRSWIRLQSRECVYSCRVKLLSKDESDEVARCWWWGRMRMEDGGWIKWWGAMRKDDCRWGWWLLMMVMMRTDNDNENKMMMRIWWG